MNYGFNCLTIRLTHQLRSQANSFRSFISKLRSEDKDDRQMKRQSPSRIPDQVQEVLTTVKAHRTRVLLSRRSGSKSTRTILVSGADVHSLSFDC
ncbi:hypothetical protein J6590_013204 [Homalodisca vitripennis]|nr:hypothetical protein J6590_013204 [Homalodisca vitripennis]